ncbi:hypothetical protein IJ750_03650 [bacterium]|nr:hypothetical protein [bacterium]
MAVTGATSKNGKKSIKDYKLQSRKLDFKNTKELFKQAFEYMEMQKNVEYLRKNPELVKKMYKSVTGKDMPLEMLEYLTQPEAKPKKIDKIG